MKDHREFHTQCRGLPICGICSSDCEAQIRGGGCHEPRLRAPASAGVLGLGRLARRGPKPGSRHPSTLAVECAGPWVEPLGGAKGRANGSAAKRPGLAPATSARWRGRGSGGGAREPIFPISSRTALHARALGAENGDRRNQEGAGANIKCGIQIHWCSAHKPSARKANCIIWCATRKDHREFHTQCRRHRICDLCCTVSEAPIRRQITATRDAPGIGGG